MVVSLPFVLLLLDYWPLNRFGNRGLGRPASWPLVWEKMPFFALAAISCAVTFVVQKAAGAVQPLGNLPIGWRIENAPVSYAWYLGRRCGRRTWRCPICIRGKWPCSRRAARWHWLLVYAAARCG